MTATPGAVPAPPSADADLARLTRCMDEGEKWGLVQAGLAILGKRRSLRPMLERSPDNREEIEHEELDSRLLTALPSDWAGREVLDLRLVGDGGADWLEDRLGEPCAEVLFGGVSFEALAEDLAQNYLHSLQEQGYSCPSDFGADPSGEDDETQLAREFVCLFREWREHVFRTLEEQSDVEEPSHLARCAELLSRFYRQPNTADRVLDLLEQLRVMADPLLALTTMAVLVRDRLAAALTEGDWKASDAPHLIYGSPGGRVRVGGIDCQFVPDLEKLELAWGEVAEAARLCVLAYERQVPGALLLAEQGELSEMFWAGALRDAPLRVVVRDAFLAGVGKSLRVLHLDALDWMQRFARGDGSYEDILFLRERMILVLDWLGARLSEEQIRERPGLIDLCARVLVQERLDTADDDTIYLDESGTVESFLRADLEAGIRAVCRAYKRDFNPQADLLAERLLHLESKPGEVQAILRKLSTGQPDADCEAGAARLLVDVFDEEDD